MKGSAANTHYNSGQRMLVKKLPEVKERNVLKDRGTMPSAHNRQAIVLPPSKSQIALLIIHGPLGRTFNKLLFQ